MKSNYLSYILVAVLAIIVFHAFTKRTPEHTEVIKGITIVDTVRYIQTDTITLYEPKYITQRIVDTLYITDTLFLPITQKHYSEPNMYDVWVSGYDAKMDSIKTYSQTIYKTREHNVVINKNELYFNFSLNAIRNTFYPSLGLLLTTKKKTLYKANLGYYNGAMVYSIGYGRKLF